MNLSSRWSCNCGGRRNLYWWWRYYRGIFWLSL